MKLQLKLALYNTITKLAVILAAGLLTLLTIDEVSYNHIEARLEDSRQELMKNLSSKELNNFLLNEQIYTDYNILNQEYIQVKPGAYQPNLKPVTRFRTGDKQVSHNLRETYRILTTHFNFNGRTYLLEIGESISSIEDLKRIIKQFTLVVLIIALAITLVSDLLFTKYLLSPFYRIIDRKLIKVNDPLNFDYEKVQTTTQDFALLDDSISSLMKKISDLFLIEKQFIANVSHELLTPISIISTRLENVMLNEKMTEDGENKIYAAMKTLNRLKAIINSLLLISKVENNQFHKNDAVQIAEVVTEIIEELEDRLDDKQITLNNRMVYQHGMAANRALMHTFIFNIINNAIKYNELKGEINISDEQKDGAYLLRIADTGIGMDTRQINKMFNRFEKLDTDEAQSYGLGLAIVKSIAAFHRIDIDVKSVKGEGTTFSLTFNMN